MWASPSFSATFKDFLSLLSQFPSLYFFVFTAKRDTEGELHSSLGFFIAFDRFNLNWRQKEALEMAKNVGILAVDIYFPPTYVQQVRISQFQLVFSFPFTFCWICAWVCIVWRNWWTGGSFFVLVSINLFFNFVFLAGNLGLVVFLAILETILLFFVFWMFRNVSKCFPFSCFVVCDRRLILDSCKWCKGEMEMMHFHMYVYSVCVCVRELGPLQLLSSFLGWGTWPNCLVAAFELISGTHHVHVVFL